MHITRPLFSEFADASGTTTKTTETVYEVAKKGVREITKIITEIRWSKMSTKQKLFVGIYVAGFTTHAMFSSYNNGKTELLKYRDAPSTTKYTSEWEAVHDGCTSESSTIFWNSVFWPTAIYAQTVPSLVLFLNKKPETLE